MASADKPPVKRYRRTELEKNDSDDEFWKMAEGSEGEEDGKTGDKDVYIPVKERRKRKLVELGQVCLRHAS